MSDRQFDPDWPHGHVTRDGRKARILAKDAHGEKSIVAEIECGTDDWLIYAFIPSGKLCAGWETVNDLVNAPAPKRKIMGYINIFECVNGDPLPGSMLHATKERADKSTDCPRIACIRVEFEEGDGL